VNITDLDTVSELRGNLHAALVRQAAFEAVPGDMLPCQAQCMPLDMADYGAWAFSLHNKHVVGLLPIEKKVAVSACAQAVAKIVADLAQLGVTVDVGALLEAERARFTRVRVRLTDAGADSNVPGHCGSPKGEGSATVHVDASRDPFRFQQADLQRPGD